MEEIKNNPLSLQWSLEDFAPASVEDKESLVFMRESVSFWKDGLHRFRKNKIAMSALFIVFLITICCFLVPSVYPYKYEQQMKGSERLAPMQYSKTEQKQIDAGEKVFPHLLGTDQNGRDYMIRVLVGGRVSMTVGLVASVLILVIGSIWGNRRILRWISGYDHDANRGYYLHGSRRTDYYPFGSDLEVSSGSIGQQTGLCLDAKAWLQYDFHVYRICFALLGGNGQNRPFSDYGFKAE